MTGNGSSQEDRAQHSLDGHRYAATRCGEQQSGPVLDEADLNLVGAAVVDTEEPVDRQGTDRDHVRGRLAVVDDEPVRESVQDRGELHCRRTVRLAGNPLDDAQLPTEPG